MIGCAWNNTISRRMTLDIDHGQRSRMFATAQPRFSFARRMLALVTTLAVVGAFAAVGFVALFGTKSAAFMRLFGPRHDFSSLYAALGISPLPVDLVTRPVFDDLIRLEGEPCDINAISALGKSLAAAHDERRAAGALLGFARRCNGNPRAEREAAAKLSMVGDHAAARDIYADLVARFPGNDLDWYQKGKAEAALRLNADALESYATTIQLVRNQGRLGPWVFEEMAALYAAEGRICEAMTPLDTYLSLGGANRKNNRTRQLLASYAKRGACTRYASGGSETFPVLGVDVIRVRASVNGVVGTFAVDTGASFVSVSDDFARRAHLAATGAARTMTANGEATVRLSRAETVGLGRMRAADVPVMVTSKSLGNIDGLLGRSFLARFDMTIAGNRMTLKIK